MSDDLPAALGDPSRRRLMAAAAGCLLAGPTAASAQSHAAQPHETQSHAAQPHAAGAHGATGLSPPVALRRLMEGNLRFVQGRAIHPDMTTQRRVALADAQHPFATILTCSDSRVPPELIFDQGLGDLFVIRVAGNVVDDAVLASIEYAVVHLGTPLVMVLGHERCGAVTATLDALAGKGSAEDRETKISALADLIAPAVRAVPPQAADRLDAAIILNAERSAHAVLAGSPPLLARSRAGALRIVSARYDLDDGTISHLRDAQA